MSQPFSFMHWQPNTGKQTLAMMVLLLTTSMVLAETEIEPPPLIGGHNPEHRELVSVPGGVFPQHALGGEKFRHQVNDFAIGRYPVTYELWYTVRQWAEDNGYTFDRKGLEVLRSDEGAAPTEEGRFHPVTRVTWNDVIVWTNAYSEIAGLQPVYYLDSEHSELATDATDLPTMQNDWVDWSATGYRLPTEGEWQYAASWRGSETSEHAVEQPDGELLYWAAPDWPSGAEASHEDEAASDEVAWYRANADRQVQPVGKKQPNQLGLYDMSGNAGEFVWDWSADLPTSDQLDYRGAESGDTRLFRGGSWHHNANALSVGHRNNSLRPAGSAPMIGFRVAQTRQ
ncbi:SUMF1/EgtB/PvdO family nonheme iron enzyme [Wenzhouxiangella sp. AB-CW3]|uniref:formylglycine-generating enzyme family protein n=1 Tax=Wenzhouxiangella sp. AB-CW3 TaxID=2771012 RepID=UPI00168AFBB4|nr:SUMF1/EgtB/PvdO family nonheme iron enzyme [Wenzhouxiangella sp. AB-CW3]QOC23337.1 SUMF1/EgtB/PvdO family nonheme iron enzyme [Wenzhouxiangella sp. AB-CW3]